MEEEHLTLEMENKRLHANSKRVYNSSQGRAVKWFKLKHEECVSDDKLILPIPEEFVVSHETINIYIIICNILDLCSTE
jgi:hypothetical protein